VFTTLVSEAARVQFWKEDIVQQEGMSQRQPLERSLPLLLAIPLLSIPFGLARRPSETPFKYAGGTEALRPGCEGNLEMGFSAMTFRCSGGAVVLPYSSIVLMQYRPNVSKKIRRMRLNWKVPLPYAKGNENRFFTVLFRQDGKSHVIVLEVLPTDMRPYLAEIDLRTGRRVEVMGHEEYR